MVGITVIIPTIGRDSLAATLDSLTPQISDEDDVMVVEDGESAAKSGRIVDGAWPRKNTWTRTSFAPGQTALGAYGHGARNWMLDHFGPEWRGTHFWSIDDDDIAAPGALNTIRTAIESFPGAWFIFQMEGGANSHWHGLKVPNTTRGKILPGNVGTPCIVWPASAEARWGTTSFVDAPSQGPGYYGDYQMAASLHRELGDPVWIDEVIAIIRP